MFEKVSAILAEQLRIDESTITPESRIKDDLGADSLDVMMLLMEIEDVYGVTVPDEELATFVTVADVIDYLEKLN